MILAVESFNKIYYIVIFLVIVIASAITFIKVFGKAKKDEKKQNEVLHNQDFIDNPDDIIQKK